MKNKELFDRTISVLVKAYQNDTLSHSDPCACAIGNMIAAANGYTISTIEEIWSAGKNYNSWNNGIFKEITYWNTVHSSGAMLILGEEYSSYQDKGKKQLKSTGYTVEQTCKIEGAFESFKKQNDLDGYQGLMAVVDCLMLIHEAKTEEVKEAKELFVKV